MWDRKELKARGMAAFKANYWRTVLVCFLLSFFVLGGAASGSGLRKNVNLNYNNYSLPSGSVQSGSQSGELTVNGRSYGSVEDALEALDDLDLDDINLSEIFSESGQSAESDSAAGAAILAVVGAVVVLIVAVVLLVGSVLKIFVLNPLEAGCQNFLLRNAVGESELGDLAFGFTPEYWRNVKTLFLRDLFRLLWGLLLIVPGIIKRYSYRMAPYILADHPELSGKEVLTLSRQMMDGQKWRAFVLDLSFLGWNILSGLTLGLLGIFYVNPYRYCTNAELYRELKAMQ